MTVLKWKIKIFYLEWDYMCCERVDTSSELRRIIEVLQEAAELHVTTEFRITPVYEEVFDNA